MIITAVPEWGTDESKKGGRGDAVPDAVHPEVSSGNVKKFCESDKKQIFLGGGMELFLNGRCQSESVFGNRERRTFSEILLSVTIKSKIR